MSNEHGKAVNLLWLLAVSSAAVAAHPNRAPPDAAVRQHQKHLHDGGSHQQAALSEVWLAIYFCLHPGEFCIVAVHVPSSGCACHEEEPAAAGVLVNFSLPEPLWSRCPGMHPHAI